MARSTPPKCAECGHAKSRHTFGNTGDCTKRLARGYWQRGVFIMTHMIPCPCKRYIKPEG